MAESKTARASMRAGFVKEAKQDPFDTNEKKIAELRKQRASALFVNRMDFVDALLDEYDVLLKALDDSRVTGAEFSNPQLFKPQPPESEA